MNKISFGEALPATPTLDATFSDRGPVPELEQNTDHAVRVDRTRVDESTTRDGDPTVRVGIFMKTAEADVDVVCWLNLTVGDSPNVTDLERLRQAYACFGMKIPPAWDSIEAAEDNLSDLRERTGVVQTWYSSKSNKPTNLVNLFVPRDAPRKAASKSTTVANNPDDWAYDDSNDSA
jgi:hypothetical protein